uniref:Uncharacterized protein n=1 Tax=Strigamia maritima TaxID=126957 RepID=T1IVL9_STRMM
MKYIDLVVNSDKRCTPFETILKYGCGPNFILNRRKSFRLMIKEQGKTFWFRFWLKFCLHPEDLELTKLINDCMPGVLEIVNEAISEKFVEARVQAACEYSLEKIISHMILSYMLYDTQSTKNGKCSTRKIIDVMENCGLLAFGCALCEVFYKWLVEKDVDTAVDRTYWEVPEIYLRSDFKPGPLELYMAYTWHYKLPAMLGVSLDDVPWLKKLLNVKQKEEIKRKSCEVKECNDKSLYNRTAADWEEDLSIIKNKILNVDGRIKPLKPILSKIVEERKTEKNKKRTKFILNNNNIDTSIHELLAENRWLPADNEPNDPSKKLNQNDVNKVTSNLTNDKFLGKHLTENNNALRKTLYHRDIIAVLIVKLKIGLKDMTLSIENNGIFQHAFYKATAKNITYKQLFNAFKH